MVPLHGPYPALAELLDRSAALGDSSSCGRSVEGRELLRVDLGNPAAPAVLLTGAIHGIEVIGALSLLASLEHIVDARPELLEHVRLVVLPIVNPDAVAENLRRVARGKIAHQRGNARGVDLNRNFPRVSDAEPWHPFAGSRRRWSPHYMGPSPLSEPESRAVVDVARAIRPTHAIGFHSFGNMLLYPWAHTRAPNPRAATYATMGERFAGALVGARYSVGQATQLYPTIGDLDDWLDAELGTLAFTVEVGALDRRLLHPRRALNPFCWMNPSTGESIDAAIRGVAPAIAELVAHGSSARGSRPTAPPRALDLAAR
jgi:carboxypeptidase T